MPSRSHARCKMCRSVIHARHRFGMCKQCSDKHYARITASRKQAKQRKAHRALLASTPPVPTALEEEQPMPRLSEEEAARRKLTPEQEIDIIDAYTKTLEPVRSLATRVGCRETYIYNVLDKVGISWRRANPESFETWQARQRQPVEPSNGVPPEVEQALENMLKLPVLPPKPEPVAPTPNVDRRVRPSDVDALHWRIKVQGTLDAYYPTIEEALASVRRLQPGVRITGIELVED